MIKEVRKRTNTEAGEGDTCQCGYPFAFVVVNRDGKKRYFWCYRCDIPKANK